MPFVSSITISLLPNPISFPNWFLLPGFELLHVSLVVHCLAYYSLIIRRNVDNHAVL